jgi:hypothetical protein
VDTFDDAQMLADAILKARKLVADLERQRAELDGGSTSIPPEHLEQGKRTFDDALSSARRLLETLNATASRPGLAESGSH